MTKNNFLYERHIYIYYVMEYTTSVYLNQMSRFCFVIYSAGWQDPYMRVNFSPPRPWVERLLTWICTAPYLIFTENSTIIGKHDAIYNIINWSLYQKTCTVSWVTAEHAVMFARGCLVVVADPLSGGLERP